MLCYDDSISAKVGQRERKQGQALKCLCIVKIKEPQKKGRKEDRNQVSQRI